MTWGGACPALFGGLRGASLSASLRSPLGCPAVLSCRAPGL